MKRILVVKPCCFGDVMMATPALRALHHTFPDATIDVLTTEWCAEALRNNPHLTAVFRYPSKLTTTSYLKMIQRARLEHYDVGVSLDRSPMVNLFLYLSSIPIRAGIDSAGRGVRLTHRATPQPHEHETELYLAVVEALGAPSLGTTPVFQTQPETRDDAARLLAGLAEPIVVIHPGGAVNPGSTQLTKRWPAVRYGEVASELVERYGASIVVVGAESDADAVQATIDFTDARVTDLSCRLSVPLLAAVCERARLYIGNDSGMSHLACAVGTPTVTVFGPTNPEMYRPLGPAARVCSPDSSGGGWSPRDLRRRPRAGTSIGNIADVQVDNVLRACVELLAITEQANRP